MWEMAAVILHDDVLLERTVLETLLEMDRCYYRAGEKDRGAISLVLDLAKALMRFRRLVVWAWATSFNFAKTFLTCAMRPLRAPEAGSA